MEKKRSLDRGNKMDVNYNIYEPEDCFGHPLMVLPFCGQHYEFCFMSISMLLSHQTFIVQF